MFTSIRGTATVASVKADKTEAAYNLVVEGFHSYFVGKEKYLTHDNTIRRPTDRLVPGLACKSSTAPNTAAPARAPPYPLA